MQNNDKIRLNIFIQKCGYASRRKADELISSGIVRVNGKIIKDLGTKIDSSDIVSIKGKKLLSKTENLTYIFHKPCFTICSRSDDRQRPTIYDLPILKKLPQNVQAVGRLDFKSEGLLILSNDGDLALTLTHPKNRLSKIYLVLISTLIKAEELNQLKNGLTLEDGFIKPLKVRACHLKKCGNSMGQYLEITVTEGRNRLIRRMMEALGLKVLSLVRIAIGLLRLPTNLAPAKLRLVTEKEQIYLQDLKDKCLKNKTVTAEKEFRKNKVKQDMPYQQKILLRQKNFQAMAKKRTLL